MNNDITGIWKTDPADTKSIHAYGNVLIEFKASGDMIYTILLKGTMQKMFMTFHVKDSELITTQGSSSKEEKTEFKILPNGKLELAFDGIKSTYIKVED